MWKPLQSVWYVSSDFNSSKKSQKFDQPNIEIDKNHATLGVSLKNIGL